MERKKGNNKIFIIDINSIFYFIIFIIFLSITVFFISLGIRSTDISMELTKVYSQDQANAINAIANSTIGKVNNTIAITAIFFTVIVASISVFQILKFRDFEKMKESMLIETTEFNKTMETLNEELIQLKINRDELYEHNVELEIEFTVFKISTWFKNVKVHAFNNIEFVNMINKVISLSEKYPHLVKPKDLAEMYYYKYCVSDNDILFIRQGNISGIKKAILLIKDENVTITQKYSRALMHLYRIDGNEEEMKKQLQEIIELVEWDIQDTIWLTLMKYNLFKEMNNQDKNKFIDEEIYNLKELQYYYGDYAIDKIKISYNKGDFDEFNKNSKFKTKFVNLINEPNDV